MFFEWNRLKKEDKDKPKKDDDKVPSLASLAKSSTEDEEDPDLKGFPKFKGEPEEHPFGDPDFKDPEPKKAKEPEPEEEKPDPQAIGKAADRMANKFYDKQKEKQAQAPVSPTLEPNKSIPSLAQLAKDSEPEEEPQAPAISPQNDPALKGMPNFDHMEDPEENPFGDPHSGGPEDFRTTAQKGAAAAGQGLKKGAQAIGQGIKKGLSSFQKGASQEVPKNWQKDQTPPQADDDAPMPSMASVAQGQQPEKAATNGLQGKHWNWKPGQKVDIGFVKGLTVVKVDQYGAQLKAKNGGIYRFVPHRGLRKISN